MTFIFQSVFIFLLTGLLALLIICLLRRFDQEAKMVVFFITPIIIFSLGYIFRLSTRSPIVDLGFFLTDSSGIYISVLFAACLFLGQVRYWKK